MIRIYGQEYWLQMNLARSSVIGRVDGPLDFLIGELPSDPVCRDSAFGLLTCTAPAGGTASFNLEVAIEFRSV
jgi:hypothetical protein